MNWLKQFLLFSCIAPSFLLLAQKNLGRTTIDQSKMLFAPNKGQIADRDGELRKDVLFKVDGQAIFLTENGVSYVLSDLTDIHKKIDSEINAAFKGEDDFLNLKKDSLEQLLWEKYPISVNQLNMRFMGCNKNSFIQQQEKSSAFINFYYNHCSSGILKVPAFHIIKYANIYNGIDVTFYGKNSSELKYDFTVAPYADPNQIVLQWEGADSVCVNKKKQLVLYNKIQTVYESIPKVYQLIKKDTVIISANYKIEQGLLNTAVVSFELGIYDPAYPLIIDPWITNYGGAGVDEGEEITVDNFGDILMAGRTTSTIAIAESGFQNVFGGILDAFLVKFNANGERLWATYYGGAMKESGSGLATDSDNNIYLAGSTGSSTAIAEGGFQNSKSVGFDAYLVKFNSDGGRIWGTYYGGLGDDYGYCVTVDPSDNVYMGGFSQSSESIAVGGHQNVFGGFADGFFVKFNSSGDRLWATYCGGIYAEIVHAIAANNDVVYITGETASPDMIASAGSFQEIMGGGKDAFLVKYGSDGVREWGTFFGQLWIERGNDVAIDGVGDVYFAGKTTAPTGTATPGAYQTSNGGVSDAFLAKFNGEGEQLWTTYFGGELIDYAFGIEIDSRSNNVVMVGETFSEEFPVSPCADQPDISGTRNAYVAQFLPTGALFCSSYFGVSHEIESTVALFGCDVYIAGTCTTAVGTPGAFQTEFGGGKDAYLAKVHLGSCGRTYPPTTSIATSSVDVTSCTPCNGSATVDITDFCLLPQALKSFVWSNGEEYLNTTDFSSTIDSLCEGSYWVEVSVYCDVIDTFYFELTNTASITANFSAMNACVGEEIEFDNLSSTVFGSIVSNDWDFDDGNYSTDINPTHSYSEAGNYFVKLRVENDSECSDTLVVEIVVFPVYFIEKDTIICQNDFFILPSGEEIQVMEDTTIIENQTSLNNCDSIITLHLNIGLVYEISEDIYVNQGDLITFPDGSLSIVFEDQIHSSNLETISFCDSIITTIVHVNIPPEPTVEPLFIAPNIFSPGDDAINNTFFFPSQGIVEFHCVILNRWGEVMFIFNSIQDKWSGTNQKNGLPCNAGTYFYSYTGKNVLNENFEGQGSVQLVR